METKRYKPYFDRSYFIIAIPTFTLVFALTLLSVLTSIYSLLFIVPVDIFVTYLLISPIFGYVELRENTVFIKYGLLLRKEIPYEKIRGAETKRSSYSESMMALKNSFEHINIKYNTFDVTSVSVIKNEEFLCELAKRSFEK